MSLVHTYLENNGYDYYGNAAEDTLVFFVRDEEAPASTDLAGVNESDNNNDYSKPVRKLEKMNAEQRDAKCTPRRGL